MTKQLTPATTRKLRSLGRKTPASVRIGKSGLSDAVISQVDQWLQRRELIKVRVLDAVPMDVAEVAQKLSEATESAVAAVVGRTVLLYRPSEELAEDKRIELPDGPFVA